MTTGGGGERKEGDRDGGVVLPSLRPRVAFFCLRVLRVRSGRSRVLLPPAACPVPWVVLEPGVYGLCLFLVLM